MISSKPFLRSIAGAEPTVPCSSTMLTSPVLPFVFSTSQRPALRPSSTKSEPMKLTHSAVVLLVDGAVGQDHRDLRRLGLAQHRAPAGLDHRREGDHVDLLRDEGADRLDLVLLLLLRVGELQLDAGLLGRRLDRLGVGGAPFALGADLREAEHDLALREQRQRQAGGNQGRDDGSSLGGSWGVSSAGWERMVQSAWCRSACCDHWCCGSAPGDVRGARQTQPPSTMKSCAVHIALSSAARNNAMRAMCSAAAAG